MPHAAQAERLVPAQRMVVVLQHWRAHLAELQPKAQLKSAKDGHQTCLDVFHLYYKDGFAKSYLTVVRLPFAPASCVTWPLASWPIYQVITCPRCPPMTLMLGRDDTVLRGDQRMSAPRGRSHTQVEFHRAGRVAGLPG